MKLRFTKLLRGLDGFSDDMWQERRGWDAESEGRPSFATYLLRVFATVICLLSFGCVNQRVFISDATLAHKARSALIFSDARAVCCRTPYIKR